MKLPVGVYVASADFAEQTGAVAFTFKDEAYEAQVGCNAFSNLDDLAKAALVKPEMPFLGYGDTPVILIPAGELPVGNSKIREEQFRTVFPCAVTFLGENTGISPNGQDLRSPGQRRPESVLKGSFYFGNITLEGDVPGTFTVDGLTVLCRIYDTREAGEHAVLAVKNCIINPPTPYTVIRTANTFRGSRSTYITDCRADGICSMNGEGNLMGVFCGNLVAERLYMAHTDRFPGFTDYSFRQADLLQDVTIRDCIFENSKVVHGMTFNLPEGSTANICIDGCRFINFTPADDPAILAVLPRGSYLTVKNTRFAGNNRSAAILVEGDLSQVTLTDCRVDGFAETIGQKPQRRTQVNGDAVYPINDPHTPVETPDFGVLEAQYEGRRIYYGDFHCHSNSGGTSDGRAPIETFVDEMKKMQLDFAAIVDHKQMRHFFLPCWNEQYQICGTEPGNSLNEPSRPPEARKMDYTMLFPDKTGLAQVMGAFPEFEYTGTWDGHYKYYNFTLSRLAELSEYIYSIGGLFTHAHPKQLMVSQNPMDYYISAHAALETIHVSPQAYASKQNRDLWEAQLKLGLRVKTHGSSDSHGPVTNRGLTAVYAEKHHSTAIFNRVRSGDCTAGGVAIKASIEENVLGTVAEYASGKNLYVKVEGFHPAHWREETVYSLRIYTDQGLAYVREFDGTQPQQLALPVEKRLYYRVEIVNESDGYTLALSNPIWLE